MFQKFIAHRSVQSFILTRAVGCSKLSVSKQLYANLWAQISRLSWINAFTFFENSKKNSSCKCNVSCFCERLPNVRSHLRPRWSRRTINHNASHSNQNGGPDAIRTVGGACTLLVLRSLIRLDCRQLSFAAVLSFYPFWRQLSMMVATGSHMIPWTKRTTQSCRAWRSAKENKKERSGSVSSVEAQGPRSRCQELTVEAQTLYFLQLSSLFGPKVPMVNLLRWLWIFYQRKACRVYSQKPSNRIGYSGVFCDILRLFEG